MKKLIGIFAIVLAVGCSSPRYVHTTTAINNPFLVQKGDGEVQTAYSTSGSSSYDASDGSVNGFDFMGSYALLNNLGIQMRYGYRNEKDSYNPQSPWIDNNADVRYRRSEFEIGLGGFLPITRSETIMAGVWAGMGFGSSRMDETGLLVGSNVRSMDDFDFRTTRIFVQPSLNFLVSEFFKMGIFMKLNGLKYSDVTTSFNALELQDRLLNDLDGRTLSIGEGGYNLSFGFRGMDNFRFTNQLVLSGGHHYYDVRSFNFSLGLLYQFPGLKKNPDKVALAKK